MAPTWGDDVGKLNNQVATIAKSDVADYRTDDADPPLASNRWLCHEHDSTSSIAHPSHTVLITIRASLV